MTTPFWQPAAGVCGDTFPFFHEGVWHLFVMLPERKAIGHYTSADLVRWEERPLAVTTGAPGEPDSWGNATGTVVVKDGTFYLFYTGNQNVCLATSTDLDCWTKHPANPVVRPDGRLYGFDNFRDPFVFFCQPEKRWWMLLGAQEVGQTSQRGGCVALAVSDDLIGWELQPPLWAPRIGPHCDCPQLIEDAGRWYLFYLQRNTRYRTASSPRGPFLRPPVRDLLTLGANAGSRPTSDGRRWVSLPFVTRHKTEDDFAAWQYGGPLGVPRELTFHADGSISERAVPEMVAAMRALPAPAAPALRDAHVIAGGWEVDEAAGSAHCHSAEGGTLLLPDAPADLYLELDVELTTAACDVHILLRVPPRRGLMEGYQLSLKPGEALMDLRAISQWDTDPVVQRRAVTLPISRPFKVRVFLCGDVLEAFVDDRASLTQRIHRHRHGGIGFEVRDAPAIFRNVTLRALLADH